MTDPSFDGVVRCATGFHQLAAPGRLARAAVLVLLHGRYEPERAVVALVTDPDAEGSARAVTTLHEPGSHEAALALFERMRIDLVADGSRIEFPTEVVGYGEAAGRALAALGCTVGDLLPSLAAVADGPAIDLRAARWLPERGLRFESVRPTSSGSRPDARWAVVIDAADAVVSRSDVPQRRYLLPPVLGTAIDELRAHHGAGTAVVLGVAGERHAGLVDVLALGEIGTSALSLAERLLLRDEVAAAIPALAGSSIRHDGEPRAGGWLFDLASGERRPIVAGG